MLFDFEVFTNARGCGWILKKKGWLLYYLKRFIMWMEAAAVVLEMFIQMLMI